MHLVRTSSLHECFFIHKKKNEQNVSKVLNLGANFGMNSKLQTKMNITYTKKYGIVISHLRPQCIKSEVSKTFVSLHSLHMDMILLIVLQKKLVPT